MLVLFNGFKTPHKLMEGHNEAGMLGLWKAGLIAQTSEIAPGIHRFESLETDKGAPQLV